MRNSLKISFRTLRLIFLMILVAAFAFGGGFVVGGGEDLKSLPEAIKVNLTRELPANHSTLDFSLFWKAWDTLSENYFDQSKVNEAEMVYGAIRGMVAALGDPYTTFLPPKENRVVQEDLQGTFEGVGIQIGFRGSRLAVIAPLPGSPAEAAGVRAGDFIIGVKDEQKEIDRATDGMTLPEAVEIIRGQAGTKVTLVLTREGQDTPLILAIERASIDVPSVVLTFEDGNIAHLKVLKFSGETAQEWNEAVTTIVDTKGSKKVVLDLRNNPGGYLQGAIDLAGEFLKAGSTVVIEESKGGAKREFKAEKLGKLQDVHVIVLINKGSASASEILAGALRDIKKVKLIGETSFGKGTIQEPIQLNGSGLHITTSRWLTPSGFWVNEKGLEPDVKIEDKGDTPEDEQLQEAIKLLQ